MPTNADFEAAQKERKRTKDALRMVEKLREYTYDRGIAHDFTALLSQLHAAIHGNLQSERVTAISCAVEKLSDDHKFIDSLDAVSDLSYLTLHDDIRQIR